MPARPGPSRAPPRTTCAKPSGRSARRRKRAQAEPRPGSARTSRKGGPMPETNPRILLARRPKGAPVPEDFRVEQAPLPAPAEGEVLVRHRFLSLDPYQRGRMDDAKSYAKPVELGG